MAQIDYLVIGHLTRDVVENGYTVGGTVAYAGMTAQVLGYQTAVLTSTAADNSDHNPLPGIQIHSVPAAQPTTFENVYTSTGRVQTLHSVAKTITTSHLPPDWEKPAIVHLGPVANEVDPALICKFSHSVIGLTPQGWMRRWDENGRVYATHWPAAAETVPQATAVILSEEDLIDHAMLENYRQWAQLLVLTQGPRGCTVFYKGGREIFPAPAVAEVEPTGAGDIFAAAFLIQFHQTGGDHHAAATFANNIAAQSVTAVGLPAKMARIRNNL